MTIEQRAEALFEAYGKYGRASELPRIRDAFACAYAAHEGQFRASGEPYIFHPLAVTEIVVDMGLDADSVVAALLHDIIEDTEMTYEDVQTRFGTVVADIVEGVTKLEKIPYSSKAEQEVENLRKMLLAMVKDLRVILVKLADRLHNIRTLDAKPEHRRREIALETMDVYSPIAHRLGITKLKWELEDRSLQYLDSIGYDEIMTNLEKTTLIREDLINQIKERLGTAFAEAGLKNIHIEGRVKHIYSIYRKMYMQNKTFDEVYDLYAVRVIAETKEDCYNILGMIHEMYRPIPGRFKDYISTPKPNMYQSLHTTVISRLGIPFEVQIRTWEMHHIAEYGIAAHWKYKQGITGTNKPYDNKLEWVRTLLDSQSDTDAEDFLSVFRVNMFADEVFVFTPKGDVINLPAGASPVDFAFAIHSAVGCRMTGVKVNGRMVPIDTELKNGDIVEVLTSKASKGPSRDWLKIAKTSSARSKIKQWFKKEKWEENIEQGKEDLEREMRRAGISQDDLKKGDVLPESLRKLSFRTIEELYAAIGYGGMTTMRAIRRFQEELSRLPRENTPAVPETAPAITVPKHSDSGVIVEGLDSCLVKFAHCCTPVPGDPVVGFVTRGYGVSVHCADCGNITAIRDSETESQRLVRVQWTEDAKGRFAADVEVVGTERVGLLADVATMLANIHVQIHAMHGKTNPDGTALLQLSIGVTDVEHLRSICTKLIGIRGVEKVRRRGR